MELIKIDEFVITSKGIDEDDKDFMWKISGDFYFGSEGEVDKFRNNIKKSFESWIGQVAIEVINKEIITIGSDLSSGTEYENISKIKPKIALSHWVKFDFMKIETRPPKYDKYLICRKDGKIHWETWNGSGWAYNGNEIRYWANIIKP